MQNLYNFIKSVLKPCFSLIKKKHCFFKLKRYSYTGDAPNNYQTSTSSFRASSKYNKRFSMDFFKLNDIF